MSFAERLKKMQGKMAEQQADYTPGGFSAIPDDTYNFRVKATIDETKKEPHRLMVSWCFVVAEGEKEGRQVWINTIIEDNKVGAQICRGYVEDIGYEWPAEDLAQLEAIVENITERTPLVTGTAKSKEKDGYTNTNIRITEVLEMPDGAATVSDDQTQAEADVPPEPEVDDDKTALLNFAASVGIDGFTDENELTDMVEALKEFDGRYSADTLSEDEKALLAKLDLEILIEKPKAKAVLKKTAPVATKKPAPVLKKKAGKK